MNRFILAVLALAYACSPALAETAGEPVTWGALGAIVGWIGLALLILGGLAIAVFVVGGIIISMWSH